MKRIIVKVHGRVQGVFFRSNTQKKAEELGLSGLTRNKDDGTVLIVAEGEKEKLNQLINWLKDGGPPFAKIDKVDIKWGEGTGEFDGFNVGY